MTPRALVLPFALLLGCSGSAAPTVSDAGVETTAESDTATTDTATADTGAAADTARDPWDGGPPSAECVAHCECMQTNCAAASGYPYAAPRDCTDHCGRFTAPQMKCWSYFCAEAAKATPANKIHNCQHAWGTWGVEECPK